MKVISKKIFLTTILSLFLPVFSANAQQGEVVQGNYVYRILDAHRACVDLFAGQTIGSIYVMEAWHSPTQGDHNRCKIKYVNTTFSQIGSEVGVSGGIVNGSVNGSTGQNSNSAPKIGSTPIFKNRACSQQQGTPHAFYANGYIYCRHNR
jgi:hypothetical protein